jgi:hypothetical protein
LQISAAEPACATVAGCGAGALAHPAIIAATVSDAIALIQNGRISIEPIFIFAFDYLFDSVAWAMQVAAVSTNLRIATPYW